MRNEQSFCVNCGAALASDVRFCENCGRPVGAVDAVREPSTGPANSRPVSPERGPNRLLLGVGGVVAVVLVAVGAIRFWPQDRSNATPTTIARGTAAPTAARSALAPGAASATPATTPKPSSTAVTRPQTAAPAPGATRTIAPTPAATATAVAPAKPPSPTPVLAVVKQPAAPTSGPAKPSPTMASQALDPATIIGDWDIVRAPEGSEWQGFRIQREPDGRLRLRRLTGLEDIPGIEDIQQYYLDVLPRGGDLTGYIVTVEDGEEVAREATTLHYAPQTGELTITSDETGDEIVARRTR